MLDPARAEMVYECRFDVFGVIKFLDELVEDRDLFSGCCWARRAVASSGSYWNERQQDVELHGDLIEMSVLGGRYSGSCIDIGFGLGYMQTHSRGEAGSGRLYPCPESETNHSV